MSDGIQHYTVHSPGDGYELESYLGDIETVVAHTNRRPVLLGYSHTAFFTAHYALKNPEKIAALILIEPALFNDREELLSRARKALEGDERGSMQELLDKVQPDLGEDPNLVQAYTSMVTKFTSSSAAIGMELLVRANHPVSAEQLSTLKMPILLIGGTKSHAAYTVHRAASILPHPYVWWIENATHMDIMGEQFTEKVALGINSFCAAHGLDKPQLGS
ncbi:MAG TPA: alpha/beta fold hydrolase [Candidatus Polarisedimenticolia bacterium]|jgi:pimeloyl-ACP methyl ester carboxylesterase|nr:alpha/beta fold hydrolase [Candidatus Polarisedimenticolia bacterium]